MKIRNSTLQEKIYAQLVQQFNFPIEQISEAGTSILPTDKVTATGSQPIWQIEKHSFARPNPLLQIVFEDVLARNPDNHRLQASDFVGCETSRWFFYAADNSQFTPFIPAAKYHTRQLTQDDELAFVAFQEQCSVDERAVADVGLDQEIVYGVFDGERIVAVASSFELWGMIDIGVMTDPNYRKQGLGKATVSAINQHYIENDDPRLLLFRHSEINHGSQGVIRGLNYLLFATVDYKIGRAHV